MFVAATQFLFSLQHFVIIHGLAPTLAKIKAWPSAIASVAIDTAGKLGKGSLPLTSSTEGNLLRQW